MAAPEKSWTSNCQLQTCLVWATHYMKLTTFLSVTKCSFCPLCWEMGSVARPRALCTGTAWESCFSGMDSTSSRSVDKVKNICYHLTKRRARAKTELSETCVCYRTVFLGVRWAPAFFNINPKRTRTKEDLEKKYFFLHLLLGNTDPLMLGRYRLSFVVPQAVSSLSTRTVLLKRGQVHSSHNHQLSAKKKTNFYHSQENGVRDSRGC